MWRRRFLKFAVILSVVVIIGYIAWPFLDFFVIVPARSALRAGEKLPSISVERDRMVYCRMQYCDFRFPLPDDTRIARTAPVTGGDDSVKGAFFITNKNGGPVDLEAYAELLRRHHFTVLPGDVSEADPPWVGAPAERHHPEGYTIPWRASGGDGGWVAVDTIDHTTKIGFSYWGDY